MADFFNITLSRLRFLKASEKFLIRDICGGIDSFSALEIRDIEKIIGRRLRIREFSVKKALNEAEFAAKTLAANEIKCLFLGDRDYPAQLSEIYDPPYALYYRGAAPVWNKPAVAVVGTRLPSGSGLNAAFQTGFDLARCGLPVVSGLAMGIDAAAHAGCSAAGGYTVAVLGSGPDRITPSVNRKIACDILSGGGTVMSEYLPGEGAQRHHFPERNRIISGLSRGVVVVEAPGKSGALITADFALEQGRDLFIHNAGIRAGSGSERLERLLFDGAPAVNNVQDILNEWGWNTEMLQNGALDLEIAMNTNRAGTFLAEMLLEELNGRNARFNGNYFRRGRYESSYTINS